MSVVSRPRTDPGLLAKLALAAAVWGALYGANEPLWSWLVGDVAGLDLGGGSAPGSTSSSTTASRSSSPDLDAPLVSGPRTSVVPLAA